MRALVLQHIAVEGPGIFAPCLETRRWDLKTLAPMIFLLTFTVPF